MSTDNDKTNWLNRLAGKHVGIFTDTQPDYGFYRIPTADRTSWRRVAYWYDANGKIRCRVDHDNVDEAEAMKLWTWASENAITKELYDAVGRGERWPGESEAVTNLSNNPPDEETFEGLQEAIRALTQDAERLMKGGGAKTDATADEASNVAVRLGALWNKADNLRVVEKQPHLDASRNVDDKWRPLLMAADIHKRLKQIVVAPWLAIKAAEKKRREEEARRAAEESARIAREAARKAEEAEKTGDVHAIAEASAKAERATKEAAFAGQAAKVIADTSVTAGFGRRGVHLRTEYEYEIEDRAAMFAFFDKQEATNALITELLLKMGKAAHKAKITVPGLKITEGSKAA